MRASCITKCKGGYIKRDRIEHISLNDELNTYIDDEIYSTDDKFIKREYILEIESSLFRVIKDNEYFNGYKVLSDTEPLVISIESTLEEPIRNIILSNPSEITVISPNSYRKRISDIIKKLYNKYN